MKLYGIPNCTTVKKARAWLDERAIPYTFVDFKKTPPSIAQLETWARDVGWETLLNRRGTTWRGLPPAAQAKVVDERTALAAMAEQPTLIKRPIVETGDAVLAGFSEDAYAARAEFRAAGKRHA